MKELLLSLTLLAFYAPNSHGEAPCSPEHSPILQQSNDLASIQKLANRQIKLDLFAATDEQILKAPCSRKEPFSTAEMKTWINEYQKKHKGSVTTIVQGVTLEEESPALVEAFKNLVVPGEFEKLNKSFDSKLVPSNCKKVLCALQATFGEKEGLQTLFMLTKFGFNSSHFAYGHSDPFQAEELDDVLLGLSNLPDSLIPAHPYRQLTHFTRSPATTKEEHGTVANAMIWLLDLWDQESSASRRYTITHEVGHYLAAEIDADKSPEWLRLSGWQKDLDIVDGEITETWKGDAARMVSKYGATNPDEDMAESVAAYRYNPKLLKSSSPKKYAFIREAIFDGVEYVSQEGCRNSTPISKSIAQQASREVSKLDPESQATSAQKQCTGKLLSILAGDSEEEVLKDCLQYTLSQAAVEKVAVSYNFEFPEVASAAALRNTQSFPIKSEQISQLVASMKQNLLQEIVPILSRRADENSYFYKPEMNVESMCSSFSKYSYQSFDQWLFNKNFGTDKNFSFNNRAQIEAIANRICLMVQQNKKNASPMTSAEIQAAAAQLIR